jgi:hypothetical protein
MSWKRRWGIVTALALGQAAIVVCYQGFFSGAPAPAHAQAPAGETRVVTPQKDEAPPTAEPPMASPVTPPAADPSPTPPPVVPLPLAKDTKEPSAGPSLLPADLGNAAPLPSAPQVAPPLTDAAKAKPADGPSLSDPGLLPVKGTEAKGSANSLPDFPDVKAPPEAKSDKATPTPVPPGVGQEASGRNEFTRVYAQAPAPNGPAPATPAATPPTPNVPSLSGASPPAVVPNPSTPAPPDRDSVSGSLIPPPFAGTGAQPKDPGKPAPSPVKAVETAAVEGPCPWTLRVEIVKGRTLLTAQTGQEVQFRVSCDKLDLQAPRGNIKASGNVKVESDGLKGACELLSIAWQQDQVVLEGNAELKSQRDGQDMDLKAAKLSLRLSVPLSPGQPKVTTRAGEVRGATFLSRSKSARGEIRSTRPRPNSTAPGALQPVPADGGYERYYGTEPPRRGSKLDE